MTKDTSTVWQTRDNPQEFNVTSTHGRTGLKHAFIGSVAEHVARYAERPVLVVPSRSQSES